jgi:membrane-associated PAP2 superfamily phosphatase
MIIMLILWIVWAVVLVVLLALLAYRGTLTRYEEDQLFLDPAGSHQQQEQTQIVQKVNKIQPLVRVMTGATCVLSATIIGIYVWDAISQFK